MNIPRPNCDICMACTFTPFFKLYPGIHAFFNMECNKELNKKVPGKCKQTVDLKKVLEIVEGGFNTQEINSAAQHIKNVQINMFR